MDEYDRPARLDALLSGSAAEHLSAPTSFSLRRQSQEHLAAHAPSATPFMFEGRRLSAPGDIVRNIRASDTQRSRLSTNSRPSPLSRGSEMASSPAPQDDDAHISTLEIISNSSHERVFISGWMEEAVMQMGVLRTMVMEPSDMTSKSGACLTLQILMAVYLLVAVRLSVLPVNVAFKTKISLLS
ncbi:hypothetical protein BC835DRAFT_23868 [Cytidiella melzeri]|nr:hypothetical protein BC835DRAFT_23868 [Cytidiella melzeri]